MKALVLKENLTRALSVIGRNISTKPQLPILANVLLAGKDGKLILAATNLETGVSLSIGAKIDEEGEVSVPARLFSEFITSVPGDKIELISTEGKLEVKAGKGKGQFAGIDAKEFPPFPITGGQEKRVFKLETINGSISRSSFAAATDEGRPVLTGIRINLSAGKISFAATDGYRLSLEEVVLSEEKEELQIIIPAKSMQEMIRIAQDLKSEDVGLVLLKEKKQAVFFLTDCVLYTRLIDGEFPKIEKIIPAMFKTKITIDKEEFAQNVKSASIFARGGANIVKIKFGGDTLKIMANTPELGTGENELEAKIDGEEGEIAFNYRFLLDLLNNFPGDQVVFETNGALSPGVFKPASPTPNFLHIIMPVRIQE